jgi:hypothetical protein
MATRGEQRNDGHQNDWEEAFPHSPHQHQTLSWLKNTKRCRPECKQHEAHATHPQNGCNQVNELYVFNHDQVERMSAFLR